MNRRNSLRPRSRAPVASDVSLVHLVQSHIGATTDLKQRYHDHLKGRACRTTKLDPPIKVVHSESLPIFSDFISITFGPAYWLKFGLTIELAIRTIVPMKIVADTNTFIAVALNEPEKGKIIQLTEGHDLIAPDVLPFEIGNALTVMMKKKVLEKDEVESAWEIVQQIPVDLRQSDIKSALSIAIKFNLYAYDANIIKIGQFSGYLHR